MTSRLSASGAASGSKFTNTNPAQTSQRTCGSAKSASSTCGKSQRHGTWDSEPSRFQVQPWKPHRIRGDEPGSVRSCRPRCRQAFTKALTVPGPVRTISTDRSPIS
jgi:hypothetical protein